MEGVDQKRVDLTLREQAKIAHGGPRNAPAENLLEQREVSLEDLPLVLGWRSGATDIGLMDQKSVEPVRGTHLELASVAEGPSAPAGPVGLVQCGKSNYTHFGLAVGTAQPNTHSVFGHAAREIHGAINRIDHPHQA